MSGLTYTMMVVQLNQERSDPISVNVLVAARCLDALQPGNLGTNGNGLPTFKGGLVGGMSSVTPVLGMPGIACRDAAAGDTGLTLAMPITGPMAGDFIDSDVSAFTGPGFTIALDAVSSLLHNQAARIGLLTSNEIGTITTLLGIGAWCAPTASGNPFASNPTTAAQWAALAAPFDQARTSYLAGQYSAAAAAANASAADVARWDALYAAVNAVATAPAVIANAAASAVADAVTSNVSALTGKTLLVVGLIGLGIVGLIVGPRFLAKAV